MRTSVYNCTDGVQWSDVAWSEATGQSNSVGVSMTAEAGFGTVFSVSYEQTYRETWESSHTESQTTNVDTGPKEVGWVERAPRMEWVAGQYEMRLGSRFHGHYYWYVPFEATGPADEQSGTVPQSSTPMSDGERAAHCGRPTGRRKGGEQ
ncbi:hypothetical protein [Nocardiopsis ansamitocini]|uniref:hypothetical protein n=1 Tax=Nocardiopsis ansamitocini TaxID=1670832 RepID=UPI0025528317|nr:hypothetical protein [Nocardiopsis ansamitocini]